MSTETGGTPLPAKLTENAWGTLDPGAPINYHADGPIGTAVARMGAGALADVGGQPLGDALGKVATDVVMGRRTTQEGLDEYRRIRDQLPEGPARRQLDMAINDIDAPPASPLNLPDSPAVPTPLRKLAEDLNAVPMVRQDQSKEMKPLLEVIDGVAAGKISPIRAGRMVREIANRRHERFGDSGKFEIDRAVKTAIAGLEETRRAEQELKAADPQPIPDDETLKSWGISRDGYVDTRRAFLDTLKRDQQAGSLTEAAAQQSAAEPPDYQSMQATVAGTPGGGEAGAGAPAGTGANAGQNDVASQLRELAAKPGRSEADRRGQSMRILGRLSEQELRGVAEDLCISGAYRMNEAELAEAIYKRARGTSPSAPDKATTPPPDKTAQPAGGRTSAAPASGEAIDVATALAEAQDMLASAVAEFEDAAAEEERAQTDARRVETFAAGIAALEFPESVQQHARDLTESNTPRLEAARARRSAAEVRRGQAERMVDVLQKHARIQALGAEVGGVAGKPAYGS
jgi:hypothetical protein